MNFSIILLYNNIVKSTNVTIFRIVLLFMLHIGGVYFMTNSNYFQANIDGGIEKGEQYSGPNPTEIRSILENGLTSHGWSITDSNLSSQPYNFTIESSEKKIQLYIYCWRISNGGRENRPWEQRIQIGKYKTDIGFRVGSNKDNEKGLLMGIYQKDSTTEPILVSWQIENNRFHGASKSCFTNIQTIADSLRDGFIQSKDTDGNIFCAFKKEFLNFYIRNLSALHTRVISPTWGTGYIDEEPIPLTSEIKFDKDAYLTGGINKIVYGSPGTGKSYSLGKADVRVTFHPEYTYYDFIGSLKPHKEGDDITYKFIPGPFLKALQKAYANQDQMHTFIIEELNRANTAAVFGDIFQLLDRDDDGWSEYHIDNADISKHLNDELDFVLDNIKIPSNLNIFATMNSSDQGVYTLDSAFKRRWEFEYMPISFKSVSLSQETINYNKKRITWENFATTLNNHLLSINISEDKLIGPYFLRKSELNNSNKISNKLLIYLWDDVVKYNRDELFNKMFNSFSSVTTAFNSGTSIFVDNLEQQLLQKCIIETPTDITSIFADTEIVNDSSTDTVNL